MGGGGGCVIETISLEAYQKKVGIKVMTVDTNTDTYTFVSGTSHTIKCYNIEFAKNDKLVIAEGANVILERTLTIEKETNSIIRIDNNGTFTIEDGSKIIFGIITGDGAIGINNTSKDTLIINKDSEISIEGVKNFARGIKNNEGTCNINGNITIDTIDGNFINDFKQTIGIDNSSNSVFEIHNDATITIKNINGYDEDVEINNQSSPVTYGIYNNSSFMLNKNASIKIVNILGKKYSTTSGIVNFISNTEEATFSINGKIMIDTIEGGQGDKSKTYGIANYSNNIIMNDDDDDDDDDASITIKNIIGYKLNDSETIGIYLLYQGLLIINSNGSIDIEDGNDENTYGIFSDVVNGLNNNGTIKVSENLEYPYADSLGNEVNSPIADNSNNFTGDGGYSY